MKRRTFLKTSGALLLVTAGCQTFQSIRDQAPAAKQPVLVSIRSVVARSYAWTSFTRDTNGNVALLPSGHPSGDIRIVFQAPYPSDIGVDVDSQIVLREADNTQGPGDGYYKINDITLATTNDTFDWDVTFTPPASRRVEPMFQLNVRNVSINPNHTGTDKTSAPLTLSFTRPAVPDLDAWLASNTNVRDAIIWEPAANYSSWTNTNKQFLRDTFSAAWQTSFLSLDDPPANILTLADADPPQTVLAAGDARALYIAHIAYSLAAEIGGWTTWSVTTYSSDQLAILFDSREMFGWDNNLGGYAIRQGSVPEAVVPASPWTTLLFLYENGIYTSSSRLDVIDRMLDWCRQNLVHFTGGFEAKNMEDQWQYRGCPPVVRVMKGTPFPASPTQTLSGIMHRTAGCWGTTAFLRAVLRILNIPVKYEEHVGHSMPNFISEGLYLSHGDDPYNRHSKATPPFPARELLIDQSTRDGWFGNAVSTADQKNNIGRRPRELAIKYISDELLRERCDDIATGASHADSKVFDSLKSNYSVTDLETKTLWERIDAKLADLGGCTAIPP